MRLFKKKKKDAPGSMKLALKNARDLWGITPRHVLDIGAAQGKWSVMCSGVWPSANYVLVEPLEENLAPISEMIASRKNWHHVAAAAGAESGEVIFSVTEDLDGSAVYDEKLGLEKRTVPLVSLDEICPEEGPYLLKLDTHGFEIPILKGSTSLLERTELIIVEAYGHQITANSLLFGEMCGYLGERGFRVVDIVEIMRRPGDKSLWQMDLVFLRSEHPVFKNNSYQ